MGKNQDPGSRINIPDPQHCLQDGEHAQRGAPGAQRLQEEARQEISPSSLIYSVSDSLNSDPDPDMLLNSDPDPDILPNPDPNPDILLNSNPDPDILPNPDPNPGC
jgi:hypothetical protein